MALLVGALLAFAVGLFATVSGLDCDRAFYPTVAIVIASYYCLFAVMGASTRALVFEFLGFRVEYTGGTPPRFAIVSRDGFPIMFRAVAASGRISPNEMQGGTWDAFFWVRDLRALHAELRANGVDIAYGPIVQDEYQMEEFAVRDPNGYVLGFGQPVTAR